MVTSRYYDDHGVLISFDGTVEDTEFGILEFDNFLNYEVAGWVNCRVNRGECQALHPTPWLTDGTGPFVHVLLIIAGVRRRVVPMLLRDFLYQGLVEQI